MAEIGHVTHRDLTAVDATVSSTYTSPSPVDILNTELDGSGDYFMCFFAGVGSNSGTANTIGVRVHDGTSVLTASQHLAVAANASSNQQLIPYMYIDRITVDASPDTYSLEFASTNDVSSVHMRETRSLALKLDDIAAGDFAYNEDATSRTNVDSTAWVDAASITIGDGTSDWLIFFTSHWIYDSTTDRARTQLDVGGTPRCEIDDDSGHIDSEKCWGQVTVLKALAASTVVKVQIRTTADLNDCDNTRIFALRLDAFEDTFSAYTDGDIVTHSVADTEQELDSINKSVVTAATENWCLVAGFVIRSGGHQASTTQAVLRREIAAEGEVIVCGNLSNGTRHWRKNDVTTNVSEIPWVGMGEVVAVDNGQTLTMTVDVRSDGFTTNSYTSDDAGLAAFTWEIAPVAAPGDFLPASHSQQMVRF